MRNIYELLTIIAKEQKIGIESQLSHLSYVLRNKKFQSLFQGSLEMQKYIFVMQIADLFDDEEFFNQEYMEKRNKTQLKGLIKNNP